MGLGRPFTVTTNIKVGETVHTRVSEAFTETEGDLLVQGCIAAVDAARRMAAEAEAFAASRPDDSYLQETSKKFIAMCEQRCESFTKLQVKIIRLLVEGKGDDAGEVPATSERDVIVKHVYASNVVKGDLINTSTGMRRVLRTIPIDGGRVAIVVHDPYATSGETELRHRADVNVLIHRKVG